MLTRRSLTGMASGSSPSDPIFRSMLDFDIDRDPGRDGREMIKLFVNPGLSWTDLVWLRELTDLPILLKGVLRADDAGARCRNLPASA